MSSSRNGINPNSWPFPLFETRNPCIRPSDRRIYPRGERRLHEDLGWNLSTKAEGSCREGSTVYDRALPPALLSPWRKLELGEKRSISWAARRVGIESFAEKLGSRIIGPAKVEGRSRSRGNPREKFGSRKVVEGDRWKD